MPTPSDDHSLKKGTAELLVLAQLEDEPRHGYDIATRIEQRSNGAVVFNVASLYPILYRLEAQGSIAGWWVERAGQRRRRFYKLTAAGRKKLTQQRETVATIRRAAGMTPPRWDLQGDAEKMVDIANHAPMLSSLLVV